MKSHAVANLLEKLAEVLRSAPNLELTSLGDLLAGIDETKPADSRQRTNDVALGLQTLLALSRFKKGEWIELIDEWEIPITVATTFSVRDIVGKILNFLEQHPDFLLERASKSKQASSELMRTLAVILNTK